MIVLKHFYNILLLKVGMYRIKLNKEVKEICHYQETDFTVNTYLDNTTIHIRIRYI